jgi:predicted DNA-binding transcriptional regulator YafY
MSENLIEAADHLYRREARLRHEADQCAAEAGAKLIEKLGIVVQDIDALEQRIVGAAINGRSYLAEATPWEWLADDIDNEVPVAFDYTDREGNVTERTVSPYELYRAANGDELLRAYDHDRDAIRSFRLDKVEGIRHVGAAAVYVQPVED